MMKPGKNGLESLLKIGKIDLYWLEDLVIEGLLAQQGTVADFYVLVNPRVRGDRSDRELVQLAVGVAFAGWFRGTLIHS